MGADGVEMDSNESSVTSAVDQNTTETTTVPFCRCRTIVFAVLGVLLVCLIAGIVYFLIDMIGKKPAAVLSIKTSSKAFSDQSPPTKEVGVTGKEATRVPTPTRGPIKTSSKSSGQSQPTKASSNPCPICGLNERCFTDTSSCGCLPGHKREGDKCIKDNKACPMCPQYCVEGNCKCPAEKVNIKNEFCVSKSCPLRVFFGYLRPIKRCQTKGCLNCREQPYKSRMIDLLLKPNFIPSGDTAPNEDYHKRNNLFKLLILSGLAKSVRDDLVCYDVLYCLPDVLKDAIIEYDGEISQVSNFVDINMKHDAVLNTLMQCTSDAKICEEKLSGIDRRPNKTSMKLAVDGVWHAVVLKRYHDLSNAADRLQLTRYALEDAYDADKDMFIACFWLLAVSPMLSQVHATATKIQLSISQSYQSVGEWEISMTPDFGFSMADISTKGLGEFMQLSLPDGGVGRHLGDQIAAGKKTKRFILPLNVIHYCEEPHSAECIAFIHSNVLAILVAYIIRVEDETRCDQLLHPECELRIFKVIDQSSSYATGDLYWSSRIVYLFDRYLRPHRLPLRSTYQVTSPQCKHTGVVAAKFVKACVLGIDR